MTGLPDDKIEIVRTLVSGAPDAVVSGLRKALVAADGDTALAGVRRVVEAEVADRNLRNKVLEPVAPLFAGDGLDADRLCFPMAALPLLWRGLRAIDPEGIARAAAVYADYEPGVSTMQPFDELVERVDPYGRKYYWIGGEEPGGHAEPGTDLAAIVAGRISVTPIHLDLTNHRLLHQLREWDLAAVLDGPAG